MPRVKRDDFVLERDQHPDHRGECLLSPESFRMSPSDLGVLCLVRRTTAADEPGGNNAAAGNSEHCGSRMAGQRLRRRFLA